MEKKCGACGTPKRLNHYGQLDCPKCYSENFFDIPVMKQEVKKEENNVDDNLVENEVENLKPEE